MFIEIITVFTLGTNPQNIQNKDTITYQAENINEKMVTWHAISQKEILNTKHVEYMNSSNVILTYKGKSYKTCKILNEREVWTLVMESCQKLIKRINRGI